MAKEAIKKKGRCINMGNCNKANAHEIIEVNIGEDFVCPECGGGLVEVKGGTKVWPYIVGGVAVIAIAGGAWIFAGSGEGTDEIPPDTLVNIPVSKAGSQEDTAVAVTGLTEVAPQPAEGGTQTSLPVSKPTVTDGLGLLNLGYGLYEGNLAGGKANGLGKLTFTQKHRISSRDSKERVAEAGDYVEGSFENNEVVTVKWYGADGKLKGTILAGSNALGN